MACQIALSSSSASARWASPFRLRKLDKLAPVRPWQFHDLRVTCKTRMAELGVAPEHSEAVLGHEKKNMEKVYNKATYDLEKRAALLTYAEHIMKVVA